MTITEAIRKYQSLKISQLVDWYARFVWRKQFVHGYESGHVVKAVTHNSCPHQYAAEREQKAIERATFFPKK